MIRAREISGQERRRVGEDILCNARTLHSLHRGDYQQEESVGFNKSLISQVGSVEEAVDTLGSTPRKDLDNSHRLIPLAILIMAPPPGGPATCRTPTIVNVGSVCNIKRGDHMERGAPRPVAANVLRLRMAGPRPSDSTPARRAHVEQVA
eukprot:COSAG02_NODE_3655_length_6410_cov_3.941531_3_plen_150_part_00